MNLVEINSGLRERILSGEERVGLFVFGGKYLWIIDWSEHFNLNHMKNIDALCQDENLMRYLPAGKSVETYRMEVIQRYRGSLPTLTADLFPRYRDSESAKVATTDMLRREFFHEDTGLYAELSKQMEAELSFNAPMEEELVQLRMRLFSKLPKFYINYDRKIFMHMVHGRSYESAALDGWWAAEGDFEHMIPTSQRYWVRDASEDFWAVSSFKNC